MTAIIDPTLGADETSRIAEEAYLFAYPMLIAYGFFHLQTMGPDGPNKQAIGRFTHFRTLASPTQNNHIPWVNTDTLYSAAWIDLRAGPVRFSVPQFPEHRFQNFQIADWYTMNAANRGTLDVGNGARNYLITGPDWRGPTPEGIDEVITLDSWIAKLFTRIIVEHPGDETAIHVLQDGYRLKPASDASPNPDDFPAPAQSGFVGRFFEQPAPEFIGSFNQIMRFAAVHPDEAPLFERFARIGAVPGADFGAATLDAETRTAIQEGIDRAHARIAARLSHLDEPVNGWIYPLDLRGDRSKLTGNPAAYLARAVAARYAIWGPGAEEVVYMTCETDAEGAELDGANRYALTFDEAPPARGFWSFTVYDATTRLLVEHPSGRYKRGDRDTEIERNPSGGFTLILQTAEPEAQPNGNWLPVPPGPFQIVGRLYGPSRALVEKRFRPPPIRRMD